MAIVEKWPLVELRLYIIITSTVMDSMCIFSVFRSSLLLSLLSLYLNLESNTYWQSTCASSFVGE